MGKIRWYKRDPDAALSGMMILTLEERGAYNTILDLIYSHDGSLLDDERFISGWLRCDVRVWRRIRTRLIDLGKIYLHDGVLRNSRSDREVDEALHRVEVATEAGLSSGRKRAAQSQEIKGLIGTTVPTMRAGATATATIEDPKKVNGTSLLPRASRAFTPGPNGATKQGRRELWRAKVTRYVTANASPAEIEEFATEVGRNSARGRDLLNRWDAIMRASEPAGQENHRDD